MTNISYSENIGHLLCLRILLAEFDYDIFRYFEELLEFWVRIDLVRGLVPKEAE